VRSSADHGDARSGGPGTCSECGTELAGGQRYCLRCGARVGPLPPAVAASLPGMLARKKGIEQTAPPPGPEGAEEEPGSEGEPEEAGREDGGGLFPPGYMPSPRTAALAVLTMLGLGVLLGSVTSHLAQSAGLSSILLESSPPHHEEEASEPEEEEFEEAFAETEAPEAPEAIPSSIPEEEPLPEEAPGEEPPPLELPEEFEEPVLPPVKHVFVIVLRETGFEEAFGKTSTAPYLSKTLPEEGELLPDYFAVAGGDLANEIALLSGQGPTVETAANCPLYADVSPGTSAASGQVEGAGCVYPAETPTLMSRLEEGKLSWKAYVEDIGAGAGAGAPATCRHPELGASDPGPTLEPGDDYETWRNPFVYFHSVIDKPSCARRDVGLDQLATDLKAAKTTPTFAYVSPGVCSDGGPDLCNEGGAPNPAGAEEFLKTVVPEIVASPAYEEGGLIAITSTQAPQLGEAPDRSACCTAPAYPNLPPEAVSPASGPVKPSGGGGKVGLLLISEFVKPGTVNEAAYFNHYSLLLSILELFGLEALGYTAEPGTAGFDASVYDNSPE
jgi:phosphatidylinositol-3-phosphatase